jgi:HNH endonuclease
MLACGNVAGINALQFGCGNAVQMNKTEASLLSRGVDSGRAHVLASQGLTIGKLKQKTEEELISIGLSDYVRGNLLSETRPPIPSGTLTRLLFENRWQCCVCREPQKPIVVHHIVEWAISRSHDKDNLAVLCVEHHVAAHTQSDLSVNLIRCELNH